MRAARVILLIVLGVLLISVIAVVVKVAVDNVDTDRRQEALDPFYAPPDPLPQEPGTVIRSEPLGVNVPGANAFRMLYVSQAGDGTPAASGAMIFVPTTPAPPGGRPVVAWAHGTVGQGDACAPSRSANVLQDTDNWLDQMMSLGWVVVSTDYVGLGTPGDNSYLVAQDEARDVVNSVRAARSFPGADAGSRWVVWGHSQGGHSALWTGHLAGGLAPELTLLGAAAAAPAANLLPIMRAQWPTTIGWVIGPGGRRLVARDLPRHTARRRAVGCRPGQLRTARPALCEGGRSRGTGPRAVRADVLRGRSLGPGAVARDHGRAVGAADARLDAGLRRAGHG